MSKTIENVVHLSKYLPKFDEIASFLETEPEAEYILRIAIENLQGMLAHNELPDLFSRGKNCFKFSRLERVIVQAEIFLGEASRKQIFSMDNACYLIDCLTDNFWERIHTGHFSEVPLNTRKVFALAAIFKIFYLMMDDLSAKQIEKCSALLDDATLIGCTQDLYDQYNTLQQCLMEFFDEILDENSCLDLPILEVQTRHPTISDISTLDCPSVMDFSKKCFEPQVPALLLNTISHWPAAEKWRNLNYIRKIAGNRCVPIEIGSNYATNEWSQQIIKIRDFLSRQFSEKSKTTTTEVEYLAQHELFDQIPALKADIRIPDYCTLGSHASDVDIKAWLGPKGTISPMHYDPKHNLLCQVFGTKYIILAAPKDAEFLYPHETELLGNTSQLDADCIDFERFPLANKAKFYKLTLQAGDCLYMPPKWWHYVRAESPSFSVSFWWD